MGPHTRPMTTQTEHRYAGFVSLRHPVPVAVFRINYSLLHHVRFISVSIAGNFEC